MFYIIAIVIFQIIVFLIITNLCKKKLHKLVKDITNKYFDKDEIYVDLAYFQNRIIMFFCLVLSLLLIFLLVPQYINFNIFSRLFLTIILFIGSMYLGILINQVSSETIILTDKSIILTCNNANEGNFKAKIYFENIKTIKYNWDVLHIRLNNNLVIHISHLYNLKNFSKYINNKISNIKEN